MKSCDPTRDAAVCSLWFPFDPLLVVYYVIMCSQPCIPPWNGRFCASEQMPGWIYALICIFIFCLTLVPSLLGLRAGALLSGRRAGSTDRRLFLTARLRSQTESSQWLPDHRSVSRTLRVYSCCVSKVKKVTASASRNIRLDHVPGGGPSVLRTKAEPEGIHPLSPQYRARVEKANRLYCFVQEVVEKCAVKGIPVVVENPLNSLYWETRWWKTLRCASSVLYARHQACAYGSKRPKNTLLAFNRTAFLDINAMCPGDHEHLPSNLVGGKWATSVEVHYPPGLCHALARSFLTCALEDGFSLPTESLREVSISSRDFLQTVRVMMHEPVRAPKLPPLVPEHKAIITIRGMIKHLPRVDIMSCIDCQIPVFHKHVQCSDQSLALLPEGSQLLRHDREGESHDEEDLCEQTWGIPWGMIAYIGEVFKAGHPRDRRGFIPKSRKVAIEANMNLSFEEISRKSLEWFQKWTSRMDDLKDQEKNLKDGMSTELRCVVSSKKILLFKEMLEEVDYEDSEVWKLLSEGVPLEGDIEKPGVFPERFRPATLSPEGLRKWAPTVNHVVLSQVKPSGDEQLDSEMWTKT